MQRTINAVNSSPRAGCTIPADLCRHHRPMLNIPEVTFTVGLVTRYVVWSHSSPERSDGAGAGAAALLPAHSTSARLPRTPQPQSTRGEEPPGPLGALSPSARGGEQGPASRGARWPVRAPPWLEIILARTSSRRHIALDSCCSSTAHTIFTTSRTLRG